MDPSSGVLILLPIGLGLLGFVEPCTIGGHLVFLKSQENRTRAARARALSVFVILRTLVSGLFGVAAVLVGQKLIGAQTWLWLVFGSIYLAVGLAFAAGGAGWVRHAVNLAPSSWKTAQSPALLGVAFGLNVPACAAPILFALLGLAATMDSLWSGFAMMALFGLALSAPLAALTLFDGLARRLEALGRAMTRRRWIGGGVFILLGLWSIWFGLFVNPEDWSGL